MKKLFITACLIIGAIQFSQAQIQWGLKAGVNYNSDSFENVTNDILSGAGSKTGFHAGLWLRGRIPIIGFAIRPEIVYTQISNEVAFSSNNTTSTLDIQKIDIPVLFEKGILKFGRVFAGPSFQYVIGSGFGLSSIGDIDVSDFTVGLQLGAGVEFSKFGVDVRWERSFSKIESFLLGNTIGAAVPKVDFDTRVNQIIVSLSYKF